MSDEQLTQLLREVISGVDTRSGPRPVVTISIVPDQPGVAACLISIDGKLHVGIEFPHDTLYREPPAFARDIIQHGVDRLRTAMAEVIAKYNHTK